MSSQPECRSGHGRRGRKRRHRQSASASPKSNREALRDGHTASSQRRPSTRPTAPASSFNTIYSTPTALNRTCSPRSFQALTITCNSPRRAPTAGYLRSARCALSWSRSLIFPPIPMTRERLSTSLPKFNYLGTDWVHPLYETAVYGRIPR